MDDSERSDSVDLNVELDYDVGQWVDYLPSKDGEEGKDGYSDMTKRVSLDVTETNLTASQDDSQLMETEDWSDSGSLEDYPMVPHVLLVENDPFLQHELLLSDPSMKQMVSEQFASSLQEVLVHRRQVLMASMEASQRTRRYLEPHIKQRASLASVLKDIEGSSETLREHVLHPTPSIEPIEEMDVEEDDEANEILLASTLDLNSEEPPPPPSNSTD